MGSMTCQPDTDKKDDPPTADSPIAGLDIYNRHIQEDECFDTAIAGITNGNPYAVEVTIKARPIPPDWPATGLQTFIVSSQVGFESARPIGKTKYKSVQNCGDITYSIVSRKKA